jgi:hypothetical protein
VASSGPCPATSCPAAGLAGRSTKIAVVHGSENQLFGWLQNVGWASYRELTKVKHMRVDHGGAHILVAEKLLDGADVLAPFQQVCREGWRKVWQLAAFATPAPRTARFTAFCTTLGIEMVAALSTGFPVAPAVLLGEYPLSGPLPACLRVVLRHTTPMHTSVSEGQSIVVPRRDRWARPNRYGAKPRIR